MTNNPQGELPIPAEQRLERHLLAEESGIQAIDLLAQGTPLSRQKLKQLMEKGGVWLKKARGGRRRLRRAKSSLSKGDVLEVYYDAHILATTALPPRLVADKKAYSVWFKPPGMLAQGSKFADHCAISRWVEKNLQPHRAIYLVHRLDRAASGLMLLAHDRKTAAQLSALFSRRQIGKRYRVRVSGIVDAPLPMSIDHPLDGKSALTRVISAMHDEGESELEVEITTGRKHQIRRHLAENGWPVLGDRLYGSPKASGPLQLRAEYLRFVCPVSGDTVEYQLDALEKGNEAD